MDQSPSVEGDVTSHGTGGHAFAVSPRSTGTPKNELQGDAISSGSIPRQHQQTQQQHQQVQQQQPKVKQQRTRRRNTATEDAEDTSKRRCVSTACIACRKRKSKCDGNLPACAACSQVYGTECIYDPNSDHRRKGVYKNDADNIKTRDSTLHIIIQAILNSPEEQVPDLVREIRTCESLDAVAEKLLAKENGFDPDELDEDDDTTNDLVAVQAPTFESQLFGKMGDLRLEDGSVRYIGGTSNLIHLNEDAALTPNLDEYQQQDSPIISWTTVTDDPQLVVHLLNMYFTWHYTYFTTLSKSLFYRDFLLGRPPDENRRKTFYCTPLLVNAILALGCHFTSHPGARADPEDSATAGDHFFREAKRLIMENDEHEKPRLTTVQALALMSVREAGCGREAKGWVYSGMSFRMACDMGLNLDSGKLTTNKNVNGDEAEEDVRRITFWGCFLFDKCWSNYMGRLPQLPRSNVTAPKFEVFPDEDSSPWSPYTDSGFSQANSQPARTRAVALEISKLCEISNDLMQNFYNPTDMDKTKGKQAELKKLSDIHTRLESWRRDLPKEMEPREGGLASVLVMHMFFQLLFIHLFRPFLKYTQATSPLPHSVSPRKLCTQAAAMISKLLRLYKRSYGLRQICNIAIYIAHSACTIHLLNLPDRNAWRDITHGVKHLEEIAEGWLYARRALAILSELARKWKVELPAEAATVLARTDAKFAAYKVDVTSPSSEQRRGSLSTVSIPKATTQQPWSSAAGLPASTWYFANPAMPASTTGAAVRSMSKAYQLPPRDAHDFTALPYTSATTTPQVRQKSSDTVLTGQSGASPSDLFSGIEQPTFTNPDWTYADQQQLAHGFGNWNESEAPAAAAADPGSAWMSGVIGDRPDSRSSISAPTSAPQLAKGALSTKSSPGFNPNGVGSTNGANGFPLAANWPSHMNNYLSMMNYNEDEWYQ